MLELTIWLATATSKAVILEWSTAVEFFTVPYSTYKKGFDFDTFMINSRLYKRPPLFQELRFNKLLLWWEIWFNCNPIWIDIFWTRHLWHLWFYWVLSRWVLVMSNFVYTFPIQNNHGQQIWIEFFCKIEVTFPESCAIWDIMSKTWRTFRYVKNYYVKSMINVELCIDLLIGFSVTEVATDNSI